jgi:DNA-binding HxlR family transcriptional regulator
MKDVLRAPIRSKKPVNHEQKDHSCCSVDHNQRLLGMNDAMEVLSGKWKIQLIGTLIFNGKMRFMDLLREVNGIAAKMLSKELQDLETHQLITRTVLQTKPITVEYEITPYGKSLRPIIIEITDWGMNHRRKIMKG